jgi:ferredoxin-nitrite reductase
VSLFRDHGARAARNRARLAFLVEEWGARRMRAEVERRLGRQLLESGRDVRTTRSTDHLGVNRQKQAGLSYVGLAVPVGRITAEHLLRVAAAADTCGNGEVRFTTGQNIIIPNVPDQRLAVLLDDPLLRELGVDPPGVIRGLVACTGVDYCHFALIETKEAALATARQLASMLPHRQRLTMHWSGCPAGCGNHAAADIGLLGKNIRVGGQMVEAVDVFVGGRAGPNPKPGVKVLEDVPCADLPHVLERIIPYVTGRRGASASAPPPPGAPAGAVTHAGP